MDRAFVEAIFVAPSAGEDLAEVPEARAFPGKGLEGDRYFAGTGRYSSRPGFRDVTLVEAEALEAIERDYGVTLPPGASRRNVVTRGLSLNHFVGNELLVGDVRIRGMKLAEPCAYLESLTGPGVRESLVHRGGLRALILTEGVIRKGDEIVPAEG